MLITDVTYIVVIGQFDENCFFFFFLIDNDYVNLQTL